MTQGLLKTERKADEKTRPLRYSGFFLHLCVNTQAHFAGASLLIYIRRLPRGHDIAALATLGAQVAELHQLDLMLPDQPDK
jgi:hypothetical protein